MDFNRFQTTIRDNRQNCKFSSGGSEDFTARTHPLEWIFEWFLGKIEKRAGNARRSHDWFPASYNKKAQSNDWAFLLTLSGKRELRRSFFVIFLFDNQHLTISIV
jgi:hypothetical protein